MSNITAMKLNITDVIPIFMWKFNELTSVTLFDLIHNPHTKVETKSKAVIIAITSEKTFILCSPFYYLFYSTKEKYYFANYSNDSDLSLYQLEL
jgi:hypothetical protein